MYEIISLSPAVVLREENHLLRLAPVNEDTLRITMTGGTEFLSDQRNPGMTPIVVRREPASFHTEQEGSLLWIRMKNAAVSVDLEQDVLSYYNGKGKLLVREPAEGGRKLIPVEITRNIFPTDGELTARQTVDGVKITSDQFETVFDRNGYQARVSFEFGEEALYGFGSHEEGWGNLRGRSRSLYQQNMKACVPSFVTTGGYGFLFDCSSLMQFEDGAAGSYVWMEAVDQLDYYFYAGETYADLLRHYRELTGGTPLLPKWAFGYGQSRERYENAQQLLDVASEYRRRKIPLDFIIQDWKTWEGKLWGQKTLDPERYPDPRGLTDTLHGMGTRMMISIWPNMSNNGSNQLEMLEHGLMLGNRSTYDAFSPAGRELYWKQVSEGIFRYGVDGWWCDCTEPFEKDWSGAIKPQPHERVCLNGGEAKKYLDITRITAYSLNHSRGIYEGQRNSGSEKRVLNLTRSSHAGQHRYAAITWSGDICASWETLARQIPEGLNFSASGEPYWTLDIGAFFVKKRKELWFWDGRYPEGCHDPAYRELYTRWLQYGTFLPMMRSHGTDTPREIWNFGEPGTPFYDTIARFIRLRSRLVPYLYSTAAKVTLESGTFMTPLALAFPEDKTLVQEEHSYLFGSAFLVCPVTRPMYYDVGGKVLSNVPKTWPVALPAGTNWYNFWTDCLYAGGQTVLTEAPLETMPLFIRAGSILPLGPVQEYVSQIKNPDITLRVYPGADGAFDLYEDDGETYRCEENEYSIIPLRWNDAAKTLTIGARQGSWPGMAETRTFRIEIAAGKQFTAEYNGKELILSAE